MIALSQLLHLDCVDLDLKSRRQAAAIREMVDLLQKAKRVRKPGKVIQRLMQREQLTSTAVGGGIAIPHAMLEDAAETLLVFGRSKHGVQYGAPDRQPVHLFFMLIGPTDHEYRHLQILSKLARLLHVDAFKKRLTDAGTAEEVIQAFEEMEEKEA